MPMFYKHLVIISLTTGVPSVPNSVTFSVTNTTISVCWEPPDDDGGREDLFYRAQLCPVLNCADESKMEKNFVPSCSGIDIHNILVNFYGWHLKFSEKVQKCYKFTGLQPVTPHMVTISAENGVSYHSDRVEERHVQLEIVTAEGCTCNTLIDHQQYLTILHA